MTNKEYFTKLYEDTKELFHNHIAAVGVDGLDYTYLSTTLLASDTKKALLVPTCTASRGLYTKLCIQLRHRIEEAKDEII